VSPPFLSIVQVSKHYGDAAAIQDVSLDIAEGEFVTFLGPSGSGKSTTLFIVAGFFDPTAGDVRLSGRSILNIPSNRRNIGMVFQRYTLFPHLSVAENIAFPLRVRHRPREVIDKKVTEMLRLVRLEAFHSRMPAQLSGGQQQRVALARALAYDPPLLLMDEPLSALDKKLREEIQGEIKRIHRETGVTVIYVTHDQEEALRLSDRVALFNEGRIEQVGGGRELYEAPRTRFVAGFIGNSNFIPATVMRRNGELGQIALPDGWLCNGVCLDAMLCQSTTREAVVMVRPDRMRIGRPEDPTAAARVIGTLIDGTFLGEAMHFTVKTAWGDDIAVRTPLNALPSSSFAPGEQVAVSWEPAQSRAFHRAG
jgi:putative spermidine/putrescine transport system ATP-binding protein